MYSPERKWVAKTVAILIAFASFVGCVFYDSVLWGAVTLPVMLMLYKQFKVEYINSQKQIMRKEFKEAIEVMSGSLSAGYSLESAVIAAEKELSKAGRNSVYMIDMLGHINNGVKCGYSVENLFVALGEESEISEISEFGQLIAAAKKYGGNIILLIMKTRDSITQKSVIEMEINTAIAQKSLEGKIMLFMPFGIILYMKLTDSSYIDGLYQGIFGRAIMTVAFYLWFLAKCMIDKIIRSVEND